MEIAKKILIVEDDPRDLELTLNALGEYNLANETVIARDGVEALDYLFKRNKYRDRSTDNPVVIMLDLKMPKVDGIELIRQIKADSRTNLIPVVILTSSREYRDLDECYRLGINAYVVKPVRFHDFVEAIKHLGVFWVLTNEAPPGSIR